MLLISNNSLRKEFSSVGFLLDELCVAAATREPDRFLEFQSECLQRFLPNFKFVGSWVNIRKINCTTGDSLTVEFTQTRETEKGLSKLYLENQHLDPIRKARVSLIGAAVNDSFFNRLEAFNNSKFDQRYKKPVGLGETFLLSYPIPFKTEFFSFLDLIVDMEIHSGVLLQGTN